MSYKNIGVSFFYSTKYDSALVYYHLSDSIFSALEMDKEHANALGNIALIYANTGKNVEAIKMHLEALHIREKLKDTTGIVISYTNLSNIYEETEQMQLSKEMLDKAIAICDTTNYLLYGNLQANLAALYANQLNYTEAIKHYHQAIILHNKSQNLISAAISAVNLGNNYIMIKEYDRGLNWVLQGIETFEKNNFTRGLISANLYIGNAYFAKKEYRRAKKYYLKSLQFAKEAQILSWQRNAAKSLAETYFHLSNLDSSFHYHKQFFALHDSLKNETNMQQIAEMEAKYESEKKEREIQSLQLEKSKAEAHKGKIRNIAIIIVAGLLFSLLLLLYFFARYRFKQKLKDQHNEQNKLQLINEQNKLENSLLRSQLNPHFIFNSLNSINSFIINNNSDDAQVFLTKFARLMRLILDNSSKEYVSVEAEIETLRLYLELEQQRFNNSFDYDISVETNIDQEFTEIPPMLAQPFIENALIHGLSHLKDKKGMLTISFSLANNTQDFIKCTINDNGVGRKYSKEINSKQEKKNKSKGILLSKKRLQLLNQKKDTNYQINITDLLEKNEPKGTQVELTFPALID